MNFPKKGLTKWLVIIFHTFTSIALTLIGVLFAVVIFKDLYEIFTQFLTHQLESIYILEKAFHIFLYIEIIAAIKIYFSEHFHFPLKFFLYIGITDMIRQIIIQRDYPDEILLHSIVLLIIVVALAILEVKNNWLNRNKINKDDEHFEL